MKLNAVIAATGLCAAAKGATSLNCDECGYVEPCFKSGCGEYNAFIHAWTDDYASCNGGKHCGPCFPECAIQAADYAPPTAGASVCGQAGICFGLAACANYEAGTQEWTREYANCNGAKACAPFFPDCVLPGVDYALPSEKLRCTSPAQFRSEAEVEEGLTCREAGLLFEPSSVDCADAEQRADLRGRQATCCGGAETTDAFCPEYPVVSGAVAAPSEETVRNEHRALSRSALIGICVGSAALTVVVLLGIQMHVRRQRKKLEWKTTMAPQPSGSLEFEAPIIQLVEPPATHSRVIDSAGME